MIGEIFVVRQNFDQRWMYFSDITENEAILIKGYNTVKAQNHDIVLRLGRLQFLINTQAIYGLL